MKSFGAIASSAISSKSSVVRILGKSSSSFMMENDFIFSFSLSNILMFFDSLAFYCSTFRSCFRSFVFNLDPKLFCLSLQILGPEAVIWFASLTKQTLVFDYPLF